MTYSLTAQIAEAKREIGQRQNVYPRLVAAHKMKHEEAQIKIAMMDAIVRTLEWMQQNEAAIRAAIPRREP